MSGLLDRRQFFYTAAGAPALAPAASSLAQPWYRRTLRWGQTNITEADPPRYDIAWWRQYWKRTAIQGVIINAGGIVAYYPSRHPLHYRAQWLGERDLFGELCEAAHRDGLVVLARMDSSRASEAFLRAHPDWFAVDAQGRPYRAGDRFVTCINGPYYEEYLPELLREIIERYHPEGFADNSWAGLGRDSICYCAHCRRRFRAHTGHELPARKDWSDPVYRQWIRWNYARRLEIWELNNRVTQAAGGPHCLWIGMNSGSISAQCRSFRDYKRICERAELILLDHQRREEAAGFPQNAEVGKLIHGLLGWEKLIPESMAMYQAGRTSFRLAAKPPQEARLWMIEGFAGGLQPWWHHVSAYHEDRRAYHTAEPLMRWHQAHEQYLVNRRPVAAVGLVWSQENADFYGRDEPELLVEQPLRGWAHALLEARIPWIPVHADLIEREAHGLSVLVLANLAAMSASQCQAVRRFVEAGGSLIATGLSSLYDEDGLPRTDFALADLFGVHATGSRFGKPDSPERQWAAGSYHTYLRLSPEWRARTWGPHAPAEPQAIGERHPVLAGFEETDVLAFGGMLEPLQVDPGAVVPLTFIPPFPIYPPETAWMREPRTSVPGLVLRELPNRTRLAFVPADLDRRYAREHLPDHARLLANLVRWACRDELPLEVKGPGLLDCHLYLQPGRLILHIVNLTSPGAWRFPVQEILPVGPLAVRVRLPEAIRPTRGRWLVSAQPVPVSVNKGWAEVRLRSLADHEVLVIE